MSAAALDLRDVACVRGGRVLFEGLSLVLGPGDAALLTGANGAGKSSLIRIAAGLLRPESGTVERSGAVALADDRLALDETLPLGRALEFWSRIDGAAPGGIGFGLDALAEVPVRMLSTGQRRRAALSRVVRSGAAIWLLDEPEAGLDDAGVAMVADAVAVHRAGGGIAIVATHRAIELPGAVAIRLGE